MKTSLLTWSMVLVATALVACGDDSDTGTGGAGGGSASSTGSPSSTSPSSSSTGTPSSTSTGSSSDGGGDVGGGNPGDCTVITLADLAAGAQSPNILFGTTDPTLGGADDDFGALEFWDTGAEDDPLPVPGSVPGTYDLSEENDYLTCGHCVTAYEDVPEEGDPARFYFQESGTLELAEEGAFILAGFGTVTLTDVVLREAVFDGETTQFVEGGECLIIENLTYDNPNPAPEGWECNPNFYEDGAGCDCDCGVFDPDCDDPAQSTFGCEKSEDGAFCSAEGVCAEIPAWWTCDDAEFDDGVTCNCECGGGDPDCEDGALLIDGCDAGQTCSGLGVCLDPESVCDDLIDNDEDGSIDCADATTCADSDDCDPGETARDGDCDASTDCASVIGTDPLCATPAFGINANFCTEWCNLTVNDCGVGTTCLDIGRNEGVCITACTEGGDECAEGFDCVELADESLGCLPGIPEGWECDESYYGDGDCDCGCGIVDVDCASADPEECSSCEVDASCANDGESDFGCDTSLLDPENNAVCE